MTDQPTVNSLLDSAHALYCAAGVGMPCDCGVPAEIDRLTARVAELERINYWLENHLKDAGLKMSGDDFVRVVDLASGDQDPNAKIYSKRDVMFLTNVALAGRRPEPPTASLLDELQVEVCKELCGITQTETDNPDGWWPTSQGAIFGHQVLNAIAQLFEDAKRDAVTKPGSAS